MEKVTRMSDQASDITTHFQERQSHLVKQFKD